MALMCILATVSMSAQIQQAWVAKYNNGIPNGNHQALKKWHWIPSGNIYVLGVSANANTNTGYRRGQVRSKWKSDLGCPI